MPKPIRYEEVKIEHITFLCPLLGVKAQRKILFKIAGVAGVPMASLVREEIAESAGEKETTKGREALFNGLETLLLSVGDDKTAQVYDELLDVFLINNAKARYPDQRSKDGWAEPFIKDVYDDLFDQRIDLEGRFLWACLDSNFRPFLDRVRSVAKVVFQKLRDKAKEDASNSQEEPTGSSGG